MSFQIKDKTQTSREPLDGTLARVVIDDEGSIVYSNKRFRELCKIPDENSSGVQAHEIFKLAGNKKLKNVKSGSHKIILKSDKTAFEFHFDHVKAANDKKLLVASEIDPDFPETLSKPQMEAFVEKLKLKSIDKVQESLLEISKQNLGSLKENSDLKRFLDMSHDVMIVTDQSGKLIRVNETFHKMFGLDENDIQSMTFFELFSALDRSTIRTTMQNLINNDDDINTREEEENILQYPR